MTLYVETLAPTVSVEDTGELIAAAYCLGVPHPTGYPLWTLLAHGFIHYLPFGGELDPVAWRANFMSASFGAGTAALVAWLVIQTTGRRVPAVAAALALAGSRQMWEQSVVAEVYALNAFLTTLGIVLLWHWHQSRDSRLLHALGLTLGLGMCNHSTMVLATPVFFAFVVCREGLTVTAWKRYGGMVLCMLLGLAVHAYLPLRARASPPMNWGNPSDWQGFVEVVTRAQYHGVISEHPRSIGRFLAQSQAFLAGAIWEFTPWVGWLAPVGAVLIARRQRWLGGLLMTLFAVVLLAAILVPNFEVDRKGRWLNTEFFIPLYVVAAIWIGASVAAVSAKRRGAVATAALAIVVALSPAAWNYRLNDKSDYTISREYALDLFDSMEPNAVYLGSDDHRIFPLRYLQVVHGVRPDVLIANPYGYIPQEISAEVAEAERRSFPKVPSEAEENHILRWYLEVADRPVYTIVRRYIPGSRVEPQGLVHRYVRADAPALHQPSARAYRASSRAALAILDDWTAEQIAYDYLRAEGRALIAAGETEQGLARWRAAAEVAHGQEALVSNLGTEAGSLGQFRFAEEMLMRVREEHPRHLPARLNLVRVYVLTSRFRRAADELRSVQSEFPADPRVAKLVLWARRNGLAAGWTRTQSDPEQ